MIFILWTLGESKLTVFTHQWFHITVLLMIFEDQLISLEVFAEFAHKLRKWEIKESL
jgi:hypothetical protein